MTGYIGELATMVPEFQFFRGKTLSLVRQTESVDCALACLAMVSQYFGHTLGLNDLRRRFPVSLMGANLRDIVSIAGNIGLEARALQIELDAIRLLRAPAVLHWSMTHFVVLKKATKRRVHVLDPGAGLRTLTYDEASRFFTGVAIEFDKSLSFQPIAGTARSRLKLSLLWDRIHGLKRSFGAILAMSLIVQSFVLIAPVFQQILIDDVVATTDRVLLRVVLLGFVGVLLLQVFATAVRSWLILFYGSQLSFQLVTNLVRHLVSLPAEFFEKRHIGDILSRITSTQPVRQALSESFVTTIIDGAMTVFTLAALLAYDLTLASIVTIGAVLRLGITLILYPRIRTAREAQIVASAEEQSQIMETIRGIITVKVLGRQSERLAIWKNLYFASENAAISAGVYEITAANLKRAVSGAVPLVVMFFAAMMIMDEDNTFTIGMLFAFVAYEQLFSRSLDALFERLVEFRLLSVHLDRLSDVVEHAPEETESVNPISASPSWESIELKNVAFSYGYGRSFVLNDICLSIPRGSYLALVGPSGGGKTTLIKLLLGLYDPIDGEIKIDNLRLRDYGVENWRHQLGVIMQNDRLFTGSIQDNICSLELNPDLDLVREVAQRAGIHDDITMMPMGYASRIGDMGSVLSGGQTQKILLARALYRRPSVLIFDEGTANLDPESEREIADLVSSMDITRIVVAHRPELVSRADVTYEIAHGKLARVAA